MYTTSVATTKLYGGIRPAACGSVPKQKGRNIAAASSPRLACTLASRCAITSGLSVKVTVAPCAAKAMPARPHPAPSSTTRAPRSRSPQSGPWQQAASWSRYRTKATAESHREVPTSPLPGACRNFIVRPAAVIRTSLRVLRSPMRHCSWAWVAACISMPQACVSSTLRARILQSSQSRARQGATRLAVNRLKKTRKEGFVIRL